MKKSLFFFAAAALALTACTNDDDALQTGQVQNSNRAVAFDTYTAGTTRAGDPTGVMTTDKLKTADKGFGVFAMFQENNATYASGLTPDFMYNEHVSWSGGWTYSPLKYWPNETTKDGQTPTGYEATSSTCDGLSFFAYAPYVSTGTGNTLAGTGTINSKDAYVGAPAETSGITGISKETVSGDPLVEWKVSQDPDKNVDLLWGVASADADYDAVNGVKIDTEFGKPLVNLVKPAKDQRVKFLFEHALSRIGLSVVSSIDQVAAGDDGGVFKNTETRVLIDEVNIYGTFGTSGVLNLVNTSAHTANWIETTVDRTSFNALASTLFTINGIGNGYLAPDLRYDATQIDAVKAAATSADVNTAFDNVNTGVQTSETSLMVGGGERSSKKVTNPTYSFGQVLYKEVSTGVFEIAKAKTATDITAYSHNSNGDFVQEYASGGSGLEVDGTKQYYTLTGTTGIDASTTNISGDLVYWELDGTTYKMKHHLTSEADITTGTYYLLNATPVTATYTAGDYYTCLPRYFMVIPSKSGVATDVYVQIKYHVVTKDAKLNDNISDVTNTITKKTSIEFKNGKSYNLKLILGLTSVKLDATVSDWQVADDSEIYLPKNED